MEKTVALAAQIIESHVSDWDPEVLKAAAEWAVAGESASEFEGRPEDADEMDEFRQAFEEIQNERCSCHLKDQVTGPVPHCCPVHDGDYSSFLASHNCD